MVSEKITLKESCSARDDDSSCVVSEDNADQNLFELSNCVQSGRIKRLNSNCIVTELVPSIEQEAYIREKLGVNVKQIILWDIFVSQGENRGPVFRKDSPLLFNVCCAAPRLLKQLNAEFEFRWITYDIERLQVQPYYEFQIQTQLLWTTFKLSYEIQPAVTGYFKFRAIANILKIDFFCAEEGSIFKISSHS